MKRASEGEFGRALRDIDLAMVVYKPPDDARNWKPCDYMVWFKTGVRHSDAWFECKDVDAVGSFAFSELRPSQREGIIRADRVGVPYYLAVYWRRSRTWTISDAYRVLAYQTVRPSDPQPSDLGPGETELLTSRAVSVPRSLLASRFGVDSTPANLGSTLKGVLTGEID